MLLRLQAVRKLYRSKQNSAHRQVIEQGLSVQKPILEEIRNGRIKCYDAFGHSMDSPNLYSYFVFATVIKMYNYPLGPSWKFLGFAEKVAVAFDEASNEEKKDAGLPEAYIEKKKTEASLFSLVNSASSNISMNKALRGAESVVFLFRLYNLIKKFKEQSEEVKEELAECGVQPESIRFKDAGVVYEWKEAKITIPNFARAMEQISNRFNQSLLGIAKRLCFGFEPSILE